ncbi:unnamed protein product [Cuscuta campestris]|uniref:Wall-associated receptor kinase galacturonan-binding domain-containing protein n=1 Tax=Cuscuta campestris TaxID=132261 RepID=A0A484MD49_9ASTE|nr:unnamed protein product [Cuscuta campestris]
MNSKLPLMAAAALLIIGLFATKTAKAATTQIALPGCPEKCGDVEIPYPFGVGDEKCFLDAGFKLTCDGYSKLWTTQFRNEETPTTQSQISRIDPVKGTMEILMPVSRLCFHPICRTVADKQPLLGVEPPTFSVSGEENKFFAVGCNTYAILYGSEFSNGSLSPMDRDGYWTGCTTICGDEIADHITECSGIGCCNITVPAGMRRIQTRALSFGEQTGGYNNSCSYGFVAKNGWFRAGANDKNLRFNSSVGFGHRLGGGEGESDVWQRSSQYLPPPPQENGVRRHQDQIRVPM